MANFAVLDQYIFMHHRISMKLLKKMGFSLNTILCSIFCFVSSLKKASVYPFRICFFVVYYFLNFTPPKKGLMFIK